MKPLASIAIACFALWLAAPTAWAAGDKAEGHKAESGSALDQFLGNYPQFYKLQPFHIPVIRDGEVVNQVNLIISIETFGQANKEKVMAARLRLQDAFLRDLNAVIAVRHGNGRPYIAQTIKTRLRRLARKIVGGDVVKDVLIESSFTMRPRT